jgi:L-iditol 2-dehydrogenase
VKGKLMDLKPLVSHVFALEKAVEAMHVCADLSQGSIKVQIVDDVDIKPEDVE